MGVGVAGVEAVVAVVRDEDDVTDPDAVDGGVLVALEVELLAFAISAAFTP